MRLVTYTIDIIMAKLSISDIQKISQLARIELSEEEQALLTVQLSTILDFVEELQSINTDSVEETSQVTGLTDIWREDEVLPCDLTRDQLLANAPMSENGYIKVRRVL